MLSYTPLAHTPLTSTGWRSSDVVWSAGSVLENMVGSFSVDAPYLRSPFKTSVLS
jgi:hypothetical protein